MFKNIVTSLVCGLVGAVLFVTLNNHFYRDPTIAVVNVDKIISNHLNTYSAMKLTDEDRERITIEFGGAIKDVIREVSEEYNVILLVDPAVVSNVPDYTSFIENEVENRVN